MCVSDTWRIERLEERRLLAVTVTATPQGLLRIAGNGASDTVDVDGPTSHVRLTRKPRFTDPADTVPAGSLVAPMPGTVVSVAVEKGDEVAAGQPVLVMEAMKMQHTVAAPHDGVVTSVDVRTGQQVAAGEVLAIVEPPSEESS